MIKRGNTYDQVYSSFQWKVPKFYNIGVDVCDKWANERYRLALIYEDEEGKGGEVYLLGSQGDFKSFSECP